MRDVEQDSDPGRVVVLAGGVGGSKFVRGVLAAFPASQVTVIGNTADDLTLHGLRICPDLDTMIYAVGGGISAERGWGREGETFAVLDELKTHGLGGAPAQVIDRIGRLQDMGVSRIYLQLWDLHDLDMLELIASEIASAFPS